MSGGTRRSLAEAYVILEAMIASDRKISIVVIIVAPGTDVIECRIVVKDEQRNALIGTLAEAIKEVAGVKLSVKDENDARAGRTAARPMRRGPARDAGPMMDKHECPVEGCDASVDHDRLMCLRHWRRAPKSLQAEVRDTWRRLRSGAPGTLASYYAARRAAIDIVTAKERP